MLLTNLTQHNIKINVNNPMDEKPFKNINNEKIIKQLYESINIEYLFLISKILS